MKNALQSVFRNPQYVAASILGAAGGLAIFPLKGLEFSLPSIGILVASMYFISKGLMESGKRKI